MKSSQAIFLMVALLGAGCATAYQPSGMSGGYYESGVAPDVERVFFRGNDYTSAAQAQDYAMLRAADLALEKGYTYFAVLVEVNKQTPEASTTPPGATTSPPANSPPSGISTQAFFSGYTTLNSDQTKTFYKPNAGILVQFFKTKPAEGFVYEAASFRTAMRAKYDIK